MLPLRGTGGTGQIWEQLSVQVWDLKKGGPKLANLADIHTVPPVPCKRKVEPCKFLSVQKFVPTLSQFKILLHEACDLLCFM